MAILTKGHFMKKLTNLLSLLTVASALFACSAGTSSQQNMIPGQWSMVFTNGIENSITAPGTSCTSNMPESQYLFATESAISYGTPLTGLSTQSPINYYGTFTEPVYQSSNKPCFTGIIGMGSGQYQDVAQPGCAFAQNGSTLLFYACSITSMGLNTYQFNANYQVLKNGELIQQGVVSGTI